MKILKIYLLSILIIIGGCSNENGQEISKVVTLGGWLPSWDFNDSLEDYYKLQTVITSPIYFAANFNDDGDILIPKNIVHHMENNLNQNFFLSITNDRIEDDKSVQKDVQLIDSLIQSDKAQTNFINQVIEILTTYELKGIEIDIEKIESKQWTKLFFFLEHLYQELDQLNFELRIVIEPLKEEVLNIAFKGPTYVVMAYNLHGSFSKAGPKADDEFINRIGQFTTSLPTPHHVAIATGGFSWINNEYYHSYKNDQIKKIEENNKLKSIRDIHNSSLVLENGNEKIVYSDGLTIMRWIEILQKYEIENIDIWRLGGLTEEVLRDLMTITSK